MNKITAVLIVGILAGGGGLVAAWAVSAGSASPVDRPETPAEDSSQPPAAMGGSFEPASGGESFARAEPQRDEREDRMARMLAEFDLDGDGELSREERDLARAAREAEMLEKYDADGDGKLSRDERRNAWIDDMLSSPRGQRLLDRFDTDGDGELSADERLLMQDEWELRRMEGEMAFVDRFDTDFDGELSDAERAAADEYVQQERQRMRADFEVRFDADGDGQISRGERRAGFEQYRVWREQDQFVSTFDSNADGSMDAVDTQAFLAMIAAGDLAADLNGDGVVDGADIQAYQDTLLNLDPDRPEPVDPMIFMGGRGGGSGGGPGGGGGRRGGGGGGGQNGG